MPPQGVKHCTSPRSNSCPTLWPMRDSSKLSVMMECLDWENYVCQMGKQAFELVEGVEDYK